MLCCHVRTALNNAVGHSISLSDEIICTDSVTWSLKISSFSLPRPDQSHAKFIPFLHLMSCWLVVIDFSQREHYQQGFEKSSGEW